MRFDEPSYSLSRSRVVLILNLLGRVKKPTPLLGPKAPRTGI
jgi:hypothetical protein